ncbi:MAG: MliC family protein [Enterobacteriaceae bacterium]|jgi:membrane-bound inhibitor of C-type lysozyme|nr:MliC family protein [Enterobacteriaceae bacterium]
MKKLTIGLALMLLAGCQTAPTFTGFTGTALKYQCEKQPLLVTQNNEKQQVYLTIDGQPQQLNEVESASGAKYSNGIFTFWSKGNSAMVMYHDEIIINNCDLIQ